ncbi:DNA methyltransferase [Nonomuraea sp. NPDC059007]|uniref:DNA methyltransferase n=1 Tax=Nonomuraea sp. NPDC059007 TaxID=3346692 RepID=UPI00368240F3
MLLRGGWCRSRCGCVLTPRSERRRPRDSPRTTEAVCGRHHQAVGRELARHLIDACSRPGGVVTDVFTMSETVLVAAAEMGRLGVGCVPRFPVAQHLVGRLRQVLSAEQRAVVRVRPYGPQELREALLGFAGRVELLIAALPPYPESDGRAIRRWSRARCAGRSDRRSVRRNWGGFWRMRGMFSRRVVTWR